MKLISMIPAILLIASLLVVSAGAFHVEELNSEVTDQMGHVHEFTILLVSHEELPHHTELSPFFRENDLIESDKEDNTKVPESIADWFGRFDESDSAQLIQALNEDSEILKNDISES